MNFIKSLLFLFIMLTVGIAKADNYYWIGDVNGNGDWDQVTNWKVNNLPASSVPSSSDNVFFERTNIHSVNLRADVRCLNITVTGSPRFYANTGYYLNIYGSANFNATTISSNRGGVRLAFRSNSIATLTSNNMPNWYHLVIDKEGGELTIMDSINFEYVDFHNGNLTFAPNSTAYIERLRSSLNYSSPYGNIVGILTVDSDRKLTLNNAYIKGKREWKFSGANATLDAGTSTVEMFANDNANFEFYGANQLVYNRFLMTNTSFTYNQNSLALFLNADYFNFNLVDLRNSSIVRLNGILGDSVRIRKVETNMRVDFNYAVIDSAVFKTIYSTMVLNRSHIRNLYLEGSAAFQDLVEVDTFAMAYGQYCSFNGNQKYKIFEHFRFLGNPCQGIITFECGNTNIANMAEFVKTSGSLDIPYGRIVNIKTSGGAAFHCAGFNENTVGWNFTEYTTTGRDFYWIGGGGYRYWHDPTAWSLTSGGEPVNCVPTHHDNVFFDNNSKISGESANSYLNKRIRLRGGIKAFTKDLRFLGDPDFTPAIHVDNSRGFDIFGSLVVTPGISFQGVQGPDTIRFLSPNTGNTITTNGVNLMRIVLRNPTGEWILQDTLSFYVGHNLIFHSGTFNTNGQGVSFHQFISEGNLPRSLILGASNIYPQLTNGWAWYYRGTNMTLDAGSSTIYIPNCSMVSDSSLKYNRIITTGNTNEVRLSNISTHYAEQAANPLNPWLRTYIEGVGKIDSLVVYRTADFNNARVTIGNAQLLGHTVFRTNNTFDTLTFGDGTTNYFEQGTIQKVRSKANSISTGCNGYSYFTAMRLGNTDLIPTATAKIEIPATETFHMNGANIRWMEGIGTGTYSVSGDDMGNNINWVFSPPATKDIYWVGGSGDWHDKDHWSANSGGSGGYCIPTEFDNVIFDGNSNLNPADSLVVFVANANVAKCRNMTWTGTQGVYKSLHVEANLYVYGSLDLQLDVNYIVRYFRMYAFSNFTPQTIKSNGAIIKGIMLFGEVNKENLGYWKLLDKLTLKSIGIRVNTSNITLPGHIQVYGTFDTEGNEVEANMYTARIKSTTYWRNSKIIVYYWNAEGNGICGFDNGAIGYVDSSDFIIYTNTGQPTSIYLYGKTFNKITLLNQTPFAEVNLYGDFKANHLDIRSGIYTYIRNQAIIKRIDAYYGLRCVQSVTADTLNIGRGDYYFWPNQNFTFKIFQDSPVSCSQSRLVASAGAAVNINISESMNLTNTEFLNITALGSGVPYLVTGADLGGNTGLLINPPTIRDLYLISDSIIVYWDNPEAWSLTSGGAASGCIPGRWTNVFVDDNSFKKSPTGPLQLRTGIQSVYSKCFDFRSSRSAKFQMYSERNDDKQSLWVYGSIDFNSNSDMIMEHDNSPLYLKAESPQTLNLSYIRGRTFFDGTGSWTLLNDFVVDLAHNRYIFFRSGDIKLNGNGLSAAFIIDDTKTTNYSLDIKNATITANHLLISKSIIQNPEGSKLLLINRHNGAYYRANNAYSTFDTILLDITTNNTNANYGAHGTVETQAKSNALILKSSVANLVKFVVLDTVDVKDFKTLKNNALSVIDSLRIEKSSTFGAFYSEANKVAINGNNIFDSVVIAQNGPVYTFKSGTTQTIRKAAYISGSPCKITTFQSSIPGSFANIKIPHPTTVDFMQFAHINALSNDGATGNVLTAERNCTEMTGSFNQNINFIVAPKTVVGLGPDLTACFKAFPYTISSDGFFAGPSATYQWKNSLNQVISTNKDLIINTPGKYSVRVNYDPIYTCVQDDEVVISKAIPIPAVKTYDTLRPVCHKDSIVLTIKTPVGANYKYAFQDTANHSALTLQTSPVFNYMKAGVYYLVVDSLGCLSDSVLVKVAPPYLSGTEDDILINDTVTCPGTPVTLTPHTEIGLNPKFRWYLDENLVNEITSGIDQYGRYTTPPLTAPVTFYVTISSDTICENLPAKAKSVHVDIRDLNCLKANDDIVYVFACHSVTTDITANDIYQNDNTIHIHLNNGEPLKGDIELENNTIKYTNTSCIGNETDEYTYSLCSQYVCDTATVNVFILKIPEIVLVDSCSFKPYMALDFQYSFTNYWQYSPDNTPGSWNDIPLCSNTTCFEVIPGFYRVKIQHLGQDVYTKTKELIIMKETQMTGNLKWYQTTLK